MASEVTAITPKISLTGRSQEGTVDRNSDRNRGEQTLIKKDKMMIEGIQHASSELWNHPIPKWAMQGSNQRSPPCGGLLCLSLFLAVHAVPANRLNFHITPSCLFANVRSGLVY